MTVASVSRMLSLVQGTSVEAPATLTPSDQNLPGRPGYRMHPPVSFFARDSERENRLLQLHFQYRFHCGKLCFSIFSPCPGSPIHISWHGEQTR